MRRRLEAARHELHCVECRVTWKSWAQRLAGIKAGYSPKWAHGRLDRVRGLHQLRKQSARDRQGS